MDLLRDYNVRIVLMGTMLLGATAGVVGVFMLLRRRSLIGDVVGHASLPGIVLAFLIGEWLHAGSGKWIPGLCLGALATGLLGAATVSLITRYSKIKPDTALAIVLSVFYGFGAALLTIAQKIPGQSAGLRDYLNGRAASMIAADVQVFAIASGIILTITLILFKELTILCFDEGFATAQGWPVWFLESVIIGLVAAVVIAGMQSVGLLLVSAILIVPAASARFWTDNIRWITLYAGISGAVSAAVGVLLSAQFEKLAAGATIVVVGVVLFLFSLIFGRRHGLIVEYHRRRKLRDLVAAGADWSHLTRP